MKGDGDSKSNKTQLCRRDSEVNKTTQSDKTMTDRYRCGPDSNWTNMIGTWPIDIGAAPTQIETDKMMADWYRCGPRNWADMTRRWPINIGAAPTQTDMKMTDRYRCGPRNWCKQTRSKGICPSMTTHEDWQLGRKITKPMKGPMILGKKGMSQYVTHRG